MNELQSSYRKVHIGYKRALITSIPLRKIMENKNGINCYFASILNNVYNYNTVIVLTIINTDTS